MRRLFLLTGLLLAVPSSALAQVSAPAATTGAATEVTQTSATLSASVDPNGGPTTVRFEYGTSSAYGVTSAEKTVDGADPVTVETAVSGLTPATTYHYRVVATNSAGEADGADRTFRTVTPPQPPDATTGGVRDVTSGGATLTASVDANGQPTTVRFDYGRTDALGSRTPSQDIGRGDSAVPVSAAITGLPAFSRVYYRVVATSPPGIRRGAIRSFVTRRALRSASLSLSPDRVPYGDGVIVSGKLVGTGVDGVLMVLEYQPFPFAAPFRQVGLGVKAARDGSYRFTLPTLLLTARLRVSTRNAPPLSSPVSVAHSVPRVGLVAERRPGRRVRFRGSVRPGLAGGTASLQRISPARRWVTVRRVRLRADGSRSRYAMTVRARRDGGRYRVKVTPHDGGAHAGGYSRERFVAALRG
jgi:hypothetical protein